MGPQVSPDARFASLAAFLFAAARSLARCFTIAIFSSCSGVFGVFDPFSFDVGRSVGDTLAGSFGAGSVDAPPWGLLDVLFVVPVPFRFLELAACSLTSSALDCALVHVVSQSKHMLTLG